MITKHTPIPISDAVVMGFSELALRKLTNITDVDVYFPKDHKRDYLFNSSKRLYDLSHCLSNNDYKLVRTKRI